MMQFVSSITTPRHITGRGQREGSTKTIRITLSQIILSLTNFIVKNNNVEVDCGNILHSISRDISFMLKIFDALFYKVSKIYIII